MTYQVVVAVEGELSGHDASAAAVHEALNGPVEYHLLIATAGSGNGDGGLAVLGLRPGDTFGSAALARRMHVQPPEDYHAPSSDLGRMMALSAERLRRVAGSNVTVAITHGELLAGARALVKATGSQEAVIVADPDRYPQYAMPEWRQKLATYLGVSRVRSIPHVA